MEPLRESGQYDEIACAMVDECTAHPRKADEATYENHEAVAAGASRPRPWRLQLLQTITNKSLTIQGAEGNGEKSKDEFRIVR